MAITLNSKLKYLNKTYSVPDLAEKFGLDLTVMKETLYTLEILLKQGRITEVVENDTKENKVLKQAIKEEAFSSVVNQMEEEEERQKYLTREKQLQESDTVNISLDFYQTILAQKFKLWLESIGINNAKTTQDLDTGVINLVIRNITPQEYTKISNKYKAEYCINKVLNMSQSGVDHITEGANYIASEVVTPAMKIASKGVINIGKGLFKSGLKLSASLLNNTVQAVKETKEELNSDPELLKASNQLLNAKHEITKVINNKTNNVAGSGINIID